MSRRSRLSATAAALALALPATPALALSDSVTIGTWLNYTVDDDHNTAGDINYEALILYFNHQQDDWYFDSEVRFGSGSFQTFSGTSQDDAQSAIGIKQLAIGRQFGDTWAMEVGKTQVPFTRSRTNFWPGERMTSGFGDQRNLGIKLMGNDADSPLDMSFMLVKNQNFGTDTTSLDDGTLGQWGSNDTYAKVNTFVADFGFEFLPNRRLGLSVQAGQLANQAESDEDDDLAFGDETVGHTAVALYSQCQHGPLETGFQFVHYAQDHFDADVIVTGYDDDGAANKWDEYNTMGTGQALHLTMAYSGGDNWRPYMDLSMRMPDGDLRNDDDNAYDDTTDLVLGASYSYGPGWFYIEGLFTNLTEADDPVAGSAGEMDSSLMLTMDYYFQ